MKTVAIIPARGGSKRIPHKNIKLFCGKPIIAYSIETALKSHLFDEVMVSTDDDEIAKISAMYGASVPFMRSSENSSDYAGTYEVIEEVIDMYRKINRSFDMGCCIYPTAPFVNTSLLRTAMDTLVREDVSTVQTVVEYSYPPQRGYFVRDNRVVVCSEEMYDKRSQDLEKIYHDAGQIYAFKVKDILEKKKLVTDNTQPIVLDEMYVQDIDSDTDWKLAEVKYSILKREN
ncbi:MAG: pseudaminic acid cytidylyltransferase [Lachnospiraceae bacterium]|nr:pseudaminic acid cytidylyltransferase [Lachnospiraceae bacterium]